MIAERALPARARLAEALDSPRYLALLDRLDGIAESLPAGPGDETIERMLRRAARRVRRKLRRTPASATDEALHDLRIAAKRARYAGELAESRVGRPARRLSARAERVQKILGEHQDAVVAASELTNLVAAATPPAAFTAGRLAERQRARRKAARAALPKAAKRLERSARRI